MTELERLELILRRVHSDLSKTPRFAVHDTMYVLERIIKELAKYNGVTHDNETTPAT